MRTRGWIRFLWYWAPPFLWIIAMNLTRLLLAQDAPAWTSTSDKLVHAAYFGGFAVLVFRAGVGTIPWPPAGIALAAFLATAAYGGYDEWSQIADPRRIADRKDWFADLAGASLVFPLAGCVHGWRRLREPDESPQSAA